MKRGIIITFALVLVALGVVFGTDFSALHTFAAEPKPGG